ncbi:MAG: hypothetical protein K2Q07_05660 [Burkholderiaceae bacterium]|nr:hypothetical protein [Burkholderiaceae bacterium]
MHTPRLETLERRAAALSVRASLQRITLEKTARAKLGSPAALGGAFALGALGAWLGGAPRPRGHVTRHETLLRWFSTAAQYSGPLLALLACVAPASARHDGLGIHPSSSRR